MQKINDFLNRMRNKIIFLLFALLILLAGLSSNIRFHDEAVHYWFAKDWFDAGTRPAYSNMLDGVAEHKFRRYYVSAPLWHYGLVNLSRIYGHISKNIAQFYQVLIFLLLLLATYLLTNELYDKEKAWLATLIVATMPLFVLLSITLFVDMLIAVWVLMCLFFIVKRKYLWAGLFFALMMLSKRNGYLLLPPLALLVFFPLNLKKISLVSRLRNLLLFLVVTSVIVLPDFHYRYKNFDGIIYVGDKGQLVTLAKQSFAKSFAAFKTTRDEETRGNALKKQHKYETENKRTEDKYTNYLPENLLNPINPFRFFGIAIPMLFLVSINARRLLSKRDLYLIIPIGMFLILFFIAFKGWLGIRYITPIVPLFAILLSKTSVIIKPQWIKKTIVVTLCLQFLVVFFYVWHKRQLPQDLKKIFSYVKSNVPIDSKTFTAEDRIFSYYTNHMAMWAAPFDRQEYINIFWGKEDEILRVLGNYNLNYILVTTDRIYNDKSVRHLGGYPLSFVQRLPLTFLKKVYENQSGTLYHVDLQDKKKD